MSQKYQKGSRVAGLTGAVVVLIDRVIKGQRRIYMSVKVHETTNIYNGKIFDVVLEKVTLPNGMTKDREVVRHPGAAAMVPLLDDGKVVLIKQYRHAVGEFLWEIPAGTLEPGEKAVECARRELVEETGYEASSLD